MSHSMKLPPKGHEPRKAKAVKTIRIGDINYRMHHVWVTLPDRPLAPIMEIDAGIVVCEHTTWAVFSRFGVVRRTLLGTGAFYSLKAAQRAKLGRLHKIANDGYIGRQYPGQVSRAREQIAAITLH